MATVIFACVHNAGRSQMAAAFFDALADPDRAKATSAGTEPAEQVHEEVIAAMREVGIDLAGMTPRLLTQDLARTADVMITMGCGEACPNVPGIRREDWPLADPKGRTLDEVRAIREEIRTRVAALITRERWGRRAGKDAKPGVLFLCTGNSARSQMAEALLRQHAGDRFNVYSAGVSPKEVHPLTRQVLAELGIETGDLHAKDLKAFLGKVPVRFAIIVCEKAAASCPQLYPFAQQTLHWPFEDPAAFEGTAEEALEKFRDVRDRIDARLRTWVADLSPRAHRRDMDDE